MDRLLISLLDIISRLLVEGNLNLAAPEARTQAKARAVIAVLHNGLRLSDDRPWE